jgi:cytochrome c oxidase subunit 2
VLPALVLVITGLIVVVSNSPVTAGAPAAASVQNAPAPKEIAIKAKKYEYTPNKIEIPLNTTVRFSITAEDHDHGFEIEGVKDSCIKIEQGKTKTLDYKADKAGEFKFKCCNFCGMGHGGMKGSFTVK